MKGWKDGKGEGLERRLVKKRRKVKVKGWKKGKGEGFEGR